MNVNPASESFGEIRPWASLTDEEKASGDWIELPESPVTPEPRARRITAIEKLAASMPKRELSGREILRERERAGVDVWTGRKR